MRAQGMRNIDRQIDTRTKHHPLISCLWWHSTHLEVASVHSLARHIQQPDVGGRLWRPQHVFLWRNELYGGLAHLRPPRRVTVCSAHLWVGERGGGDDTRFYLLFPVDCCHKFPGSYCTFPSQIYQSESITFPKNNSIISSQTCHSETLTFQRTICTLPSQTCKMKGIAFPGTYFIFPAQTFQNENITFPLKHSEGHKIAISVLSL